MRKILHSRVSAVSVGAVLVVGLGASGAVAANMVNSHDIRNQSIRGVDIARGAIDSSELGNQSVRAEDILRNSIGESELKPNSVGVDQLTGWASEKVGEVNGLRHRVDALEADGGTTGAMVQDFVRSPLTSDFGDIAAATVATFPVEKDSSVLINARATLQNLESADGFRPDLDWGTCRLYWADVTDSNDFLDATTVALGQDPGEVTFSPVTLTAIATNSGDETRNVDLRCFSGVDKAGELDDRTVADVSVTGIEVDVADSE